MRNAAHKLVVPVYLFLCLVLGGSSQSVWGVLALQIIAIGIIVWAFIAPADLINRSGKQLLLFVLAVVGLIGLQLVPLPASVWTSLPGRNLIEQGYQVLDQPLPWLAVSLAPYHTLGTVLSLLPPLAIVLGVIRLRAFSATGVAVAIICGMIAGVLLGYLQAITGRFGEADWYLYDYTNVGSAVGFFANRNHMGTLLLVALPFAAALFFTDMSEDRKRGFSLKIVGVAAVIVIFLGIAINGSLAAVVLAVPVLAASATLVPSLSRFRVVVATITGVALIGAIIFLAASPVQPKLTGESVSSIESRQEIWAHTVDQIRSTFPVGTGLGTFEEVYASTEPDEAAKTTYVNHAHNDYLQVVLEGGVPGLLLVLLFIVWWGRLAARTFSVSPPNPFASAAVIASGAILAHSVVDYPLRTTAIAATFALCVALMTRPRIDAPLGKSRRSAARPRHIVLG